MFYLLRVALFSSCTFFAQFLCCNFFRVAFSSCWPFFVLLSFHGTSFFLLGFFHVPPFSSCISSPVAVFHVFLLHFSWCPLLCWFPSHCALFTLHSVMSHSFHVVPLLCTTFLILYSFHNTISQSIEIADIPCYNCT